MGDRQRRRSWVDSWYEDGTNWKRSIGATFKEDPPWPETSHDSCVRIAPLGEQVEIVADIL